MVDERYELMGRALDAGRRVRRSAAPNPAVGAVVMTTDGRSFVGATEPPGGRHAEIVALDEARVAGADTAGSTVIATLEPCCHHGRTGPCTDALIAAGVTTVVAALTDPDGNVAGRGFGALTAAGIEVDVGLRADEAADQLRAYLHQRATGRPFVVLKMASTLDGRTAAPDGTSRWITGPAARDAVHTLRAESDAVLVGSGTVKADDPALTVRNGAGPDPQRIVLGHAAEGAAIHPCWEMNGPLPAVLANLGVRGVLQVLVEGGATVARAFHEAGLVDRYVFHLAPALAGGNDSRPLFTGAGAPTIAAFWRGRLVSSRTLGDDVEIIVEPDSPPVSQRGDHL